MTVVCRPAALPVDITLDDRGGDAAVIDGCTDQVPGFVDDLQLGEFGESFFGEFDADARLLGAAERDVRRHVEVFVDPDRAGLDLLATS